MIDRKIDYAVELTIYTDVPRVLELVNSDPSALLPLKEKELLTWVNKQHSLVARLQSGLVIAHQAATVWPQSGWIEGRAAIVDPEFRKYGIGTSMKSNIDNRILEEYPGATIISFTEAGSKIRGIVQKRGFVELPLVNVPKEFFTVCPDNCFLKTGIDCGCKVFIYNSRVKSSNSLKP